MLQVTDLQAGYGESQVLFDVSIKVEEGQVVSLVGSNAAGKTTMLNAISGIIMPWKGKITFKGQDITTMPPHERVELGLIQTPEGRRLFPNMTVLENLMLGQYSKRARSTGKNIKEKLEEIYQRFPRLYERRHQPAGQMSGGEQQMCAVGRSLMSEPSLLIFDEPSLGLAPIIVEQMFEIINEIRNDGVTILLIEQNVSKALKLADNAYVLEDGRIKLQGPGAELLANEELKAAYLGI